MMQDKSKGQGQTAITFATPMNESYHGQEQALGKTQVCSGVASIHRLAALEKLLLRGSCHSGLDYRNSVRTASREEAIPTRIYNGQLTG